VDAEPPAVLRVCEHFDAALRLPQGLGAVVGPEREDTLPVVDPGSLELFLRRPDGRDLGRDDAGDGVVVDVSVAAGRASPYVRPPVSYPGVA